jgi:hypothetical protein
MSQESINPTDPRVNAGGNAYGYGEQRSWHFDPPVAIDSSRRLLDVVK